VTALRAVLPVFVATRLGVLIAGYFAVAAFGYAAGEPRLRMYADEWRNLPFRYDVGWYFSIAENGYGWTPTEGQHSIVFFPAFPLAVRALTFLLGDRLMIAGMLVALAAGLVAFIYVFRLGREMLSEAQASAATAFLAAYPFAVFYSVPYSEPLFLAATAGAWFHVRRQQWLAGGAWALVAALTRPNGVLISLPIALEVAATLRRQRADGTRLTFTALAARALVAAMPAAGLVLYSAYIYSLTGHPLQWLMGQSGWGRQFMPPSTFVSDWARTPMHFGSSVGAEAMADFLAATFALAMLSLTIPVYRRFGLAYASLVPALLLPPVLSGFLSLGRMTCVVFPVFLWLGAVVPERHRSAWLAAFAMGQALVAAMFFTWRPVF
jgi:hypothetical protein